MGNFEKAVAAEGVSDLKINLAGPIRNGWIAGGRGTGVG